MGELCGIWPTMITPYTAANGIDYGAVEQLVEFYSKHKVDGIFALCQSSEMFYLTRAEKREILKRILTLLPREIGLVVSGHTADAPGEQTSQIQDLVDGRVAAYVLVSNRFAAKHESDDVLIQNMDRFLNAVPDLPLGVYECPYPYKRLLSPKVIDYCVQSGRFVFIKDTSCNVETIRQRLQQTRGTRIRLLNANSATLLQTLHLGADGYCGIMANFHPQLYTWLWRNYCTQPNRAKVLQDFLGVSSLVERQYYPVSAKHFLQLEGLDLGLSSRVPDRGDYTSGMRLETEQFWRLSHLVEDTLLQGDADTDGIGIKKEETC